MFTSFFIADPPFPAFLPKALTSSKDVHEWFPENSVRPTDGNAIPRMKKGGLRN
jgi:hypothetical protein